MSNKLITPKHKIINHHHDNNNNNVALDKKPPKSKKARGIMNVIKVALYMIKRKKFHGKKSMSATTAAFLTRLLRSVYRPLNLQDSNAGGKSQVLVQPPSTTTPLPPPSTEGGEVTPRVVVVSPQMNNEVSPSHSHYSYSLSSSSYSSSSSSIGGMSSRYASAHSLYDLDIHEEEDEEEEVDAYYDGLEGDEMIDEKAEMFIAKFYHHMRFQN